MKKINILTVHGAWASPLCFNYIKEKILTSNFYDKNSININFIDFQYDCMTEDLYDIISKLGVLIDDLFNEDFYIISHSLGGIISENVSLRKNVKKIITISSPLKGIELNYFTKLFVYNKAPFLLKLSPNSPFIKTTESIINSHIKPRLRIISIKGFNMGITEPNDGVVTVRSQFTVRHDLPLTEYIFDNENHHEILLSWTVAENIINFLAK